MRTFAKKALIVLLVFCLLSICGCSSNKKGYASDDRDDEPITDGIDGNVNTAGSSDSSTDIAIDPFAGLVVEFDGISPYCTISFNNSNCSLDAQTYVSYSLDRFDIITSGYFAVNDTVTVYAFVAPSKEEGVTYRLTEASKEYRVTDVPEYITALTSDMDVAQLKAEMDDYLASLTSFTTGSYNFDFQVRNFISHTVPESGAKYFSSLKVNRRDQFGKDLDCFNRVDITYGMTITCEGNLFDSDNGDFNRYFTIIAENIVRYPDGTLGWGKEDPATLSLTHKVDFNSMDSLISNQITAIKSDYNVTEVSDFLD